MGCIVVKQKEKKESNDQSGESVCGRMETLEIELIMEILSRVPTLDLPKLRYVCKRWNNILKDPLFPRLHYFHSTSKPNENRVLILKQSSNLYFVDLSNKMSPRRIAIDLPCLPKNFSDYKLIGSCNGLLCLRSKESSEIFVLNPFTRQHLFILVPLKSSGDNKILSWGFGFNEPAQLFKVIMIFESRNDYGLSLETIICDLGSDGSVNWRNIGLTNLFHVFPHLYHGFDILACLVNGRLHWPCRSQSTFSKAIISFNLANEEFRMIHLPGDAQYNSGTTYFNMIELRGCLCIFINKFLETLNAQLWVMMEYGVKASWVKIFDTQPDIPKGVTNINYYYSGASMFLGLGSLKVGELVMRTYEGAILISSDSRCELKLLLPLERSQISNQWIVHTSCLNWI